MSRKPETAATPGGGGLVIAIFGPTGVGKTAVATGVAEALGTRVVSCDSMQLYRGLPILTNQPRTSETRRVRHELVAIADATAEWSAVEYARRARPLLDEDLRSRGAAVIAGGTGLYLRAALAPLDAPDAPDLGSRSRLEQRARDEGPAALHAELTALDPPAAARIHPANVRRVVRALEVASSGSGAPWSGRDDLWRPQYYHPTVVVGLTAEREVLYRRIDERASRMFAEGVLEEVRAFRARASVSGSTEGGSARGVERALGYRVLCEVLDGVTGEGEARELVAAATRRYARRQLTWMRKVEGAVIIDATRRTADECAALIVAEARRARGDVGRDW